MLILSSLAFLWMKFWRLSVLYMSVALYCAAFFFCLLFQYLFGVLLLPSSHLTKWCGFPMLIKMCLPRFLVRWSLKTWGKAWWNNWETCPADGNKLWLSIFFHISQFSYVKKLACSNCLLTLKVSTANVHYLLILSWFGKFSAGTDLWKV